MTYAHILSAFIDKFYIDTFFTRMFFHNSKTLAFQWQCSRIKAPTTKLLWNSYLMKMCIYVSLHIKTFTIVMCVCVCTMYNVYVLGVSVLYMNSKKNNLQTWMAERERKPYRPATVKWCVEWMTHRESVYFEKLHNKERQQKNPNHTISNFLNSHSTTEYFISPTFDYFKFDKFRAAAATAIYISYIRKLNFWLNCHIHLSDKQSLPPQSSSSQQQPLSPPKNFIVKNVCIFHLTNWKRKYDKITTGI